MLVFDRLFCPICEVAGTPDDFDKLTVVEPHAYRCRTCGLGFEGRLSTQPAGDYTRQNYDHHRNAGDGGSRWERFHHDSAVASARLAQLGPVLPPGGRWVDVGCSNGALLALLRRRGWLVLGVEADAKAAEEVRKVLGFPTTDFHTWLSTAGLAEDHKVQVVSFFDVIEHLLDPVGVLRTAASSLRPDGLLVIEVPDFDTADDFPTWKHRRTSASPNVLGQNDWVTEHVWHFTAASLDSLRVRHLTGFAQAKPPFRPLPGRLQVAWRKPDDGAVKRTPDHDKAALVAAAIDLLRMPPEKRTKQLADLRGKSEEAWQAVTVELRKLADHAAHVAR